MANSNNFGGRTNSWLARKNWYRKHLVRAYLYLIIGFILYVIVISLGASPETAIGIIAAATIFAFHEYMSFQVDHIIQRASQISYLPDEFSQFRRPIIVLVDLFVATPMFSFGHYSDKYVKIFVVVSAFVLFSYLSGAFFLKWAKELLSPIWKHSEKYPRIIYFGWPSIFLLSVALLNISYGFTLVDILLFPPIILENGYILALFAYIIISFTILVVLFTALGIFYYYIAPPLLLIMIVYSSILSPELVFGPELASMPYEMRVWVAISLTIVVGVVLYNEGITKYQNDNTE
jgi:hypothetical protein